MPEKERTAPLAEEVKVEVLRFGHGSRPSSRPDLLAREEPIEFRIGGRGIAVTMRTPGHDQELAAGFLYCEGLLKRRRDLVEIAPCLKGEAPDNTLNVFLAPDVAVDFAQLTRHVFASSSCGLCGKASIETVHQRFPPVTSLIRLKREYFAKIVARMDAGQRVFTRTGGLHAAAIFNRRGGLVVLREDVGRHNAVDKVIGHGFLKGLLPFDSHVLLVSGRASFEIVQKALAARIPVVAAVSAPSSLAVEFAQESGQTLVGFLRDGRMNIYSRPERVRHGAQE
jgi:FdhD protein